MPLWCSGVSRSPDIAPAESVGLRACVTAWRDCACAPGGRVVPYDRYQAPRCPRLWGLTMNRTRIASVIIVVLVLGGIAVAHALPTPNEMVISVLYFEDNTQEEKSAWLSKGLADMLVTDIARTKGITVVQRENVQKVLKEQVFSLSDLADETKIAEAGKLLGANVLLTGAYSRAGPTLRIDAQLVDVQTGATVNATSVQGKNVLNLQKQLSLRVLGNSQLLSYP